MNELAHRCACEVGRTIGSSKSALAPPPLPGLGSYDPATSERDFLSPGSSSSDRRRACFRPLHSCAVDRGQYLSATSSALEVELGEGRKRNVGILFLTSFAGSHAFHAWLVIRTLQRGFIHIFVGAIMSLSVGLFFLGLLIFFGRESCRFNQNQ